MCIAQGNILGRVIGSDNFAKLDPLMGAAERFDSKNVAPKLTGALGMNPATQKAAPQYQEQKNPVYATSATRPGLYSNSLITDIRPTNTRATDTARSTLLGQ